MDQGWIKSGHIRDDVLGPFSASRMAIGGRHRASKRSKMAINGRFVAVSRPGGSKLVDQHGSRLDQVWAHPGRCVRTLSRVQNHSGGMAIGGVMGFKRAFWPFYGLFGLFMALLYQDGHL